MTTTLPDPSPSPWSVPRPDGPLATALRHAQAQRSLSPALEPHEAPADIPLEMLPDLQPVEPPPALPPEVLEHDIEELAREARARDDLREAMAIALEWPQQAQAAPPRHGLRPWWVWLALAATVALAGGAASVAVSISSGDAQPITQLPLKLEKRLSVPR